MNCPKHPSQPAENCQLCLEDKQFSNILASLFPQSPNTRYWENKQTHWQYHFSTERDAGGKFWALAYKPAGKNARTNPTRWQLAKKVGFTRRKIAHARAYKWYQASLVKDQPASP